MGVKLVSSSAGSVELVAPVTASNYTATMPAKTGTVAMDGPAFSAYSNATQAVSSGTFTKVSFQVEEFDTNSNFNNTGSTVGSTPAYAFLPTVAGYYLVELSLVMSNGGAAASLYAIIYKNGTAAKQGSLISPAINTTYNPVCTALMYMNGSTDYIEAYAYQNTGGSQNISNNAGQTYFQASLVRGA